MQVNIPYMDDMGLGEYFFGTFFQVFSARKSKLVGQREEEMNHLLFMGALMLGLLGFYQRYKKNTHKH